MSFPAVPRARSVSTPPRPTSVGPKWLSAILPTPPDPDKGEAAPIGKRPKRQFAAFDFGFVRLTSDDTPEPKPERCYEELEEEPEIPVPCVKLKDGRELRPLLKHRKRSASHHTPGSGKWNTNPSPPLSISSLPSLHSSSSSNSISSEGSETQPHAHPHVHFSDCLENVCVFDESAPAHDADPTHSPLEPPRPRSPPKSSPRIRTRQLRLPGTVIASPSHRAALGFDSGETSPVSPTTPGRDMHLTLACDSTLPSSASAPTHGMLTTLHVGLSPAKDALVGLVRVRNIAFEKHVQVVYTADGWQTRREAYGRWTDAYSLGVDDIPQRPEGYDDFEFSLPLHDLGISGSVGSAVRSRFLRFAIKYQVPGQGEWWDNREGHNWTARFRAVASDI